MIRFLIVAGSVGWMAFIAVALAWLHAAAQAGDRWDQTMADHHQDKDQT